MKWTFPGWNSCSTLGVGGAWSQRDRVHSRALPPPTSHPQPATPASQSSSLSFGAAAGGWRLAGCVGWVSPEWFCAGLKSRLGQTCLPRPCLPRHPERGRHWGGAAQRGFLLYQMGWGGLALWPHLPLLVTSGFRGRGGACPVPEPGDQRLCGPGAEAGGAAPEAVSHWKRRLKDRFSQDAVPKCERGEVATGETLTDAVPRVGRPSPNGGAPHGPSTSSQREGGWQHPLLIPFLPQPETGGVLASFPGH